MCGIIGEVRFDSTKINLFEFNRMRDAMVHRGPDGKDTVLLKDETIALGHRRLSIIDLSDNAKQPMSNEDKTVWLTYNGEIYNFKELKLELVDKGHYFKSNSDSEVLIHGYEEWGFAELLRKINGMFSFAIYDLNIQKIFGARDRFGIKPFYYLLDKNKFLFSSELKAISKRRDIVLNLNEDSIADFFIYSYVPSPNTIWKESFKLPAANFFVLDLQTRCIKVSEYWSPSFGFKNISKNQAYDEFIELFQNKVRASTISDVEVGVFLSGGYDSSSILKSISGYQNTSSFSIGFEDSSRSEHAQARSIAEIFNSNHSELILTKNWNYENVILNLWNYYDEPYAISSMIPYYLISEMASKKVKVAMSGDGGDELMAGYNWYNNIQDDVNNTMVSRIRNRVFGLNSSRVIKNYNNYMTGVTSDISLRSVLNMNIVQRIEYRDLWFFNNNYVETTDVIKNIQQLDIKTFVTESSLTRADMSSMAFSLEVRVPFLDHELFQYVLGLSTDLYFNSNVKKPLLRKYLKNSLPVSILDMPKYGFSHQHLKEITNQIFDKYIVNGALMSNSVLVNSKYFDSLNTSTRFHLLMLEIWFRKNLNI